MQAIDAEDDQGDALADSLRVKVGGRDRTRKTSGPAWISMDSAGPETATKPPPELLSAVGLFGFTKSGGLITAAVESARNRDAVLVRSVVDDVVLNGETPDTRGDLVACPPGSRMVGEEAESVDNIAYHSIRGVAACVLRDSQPNVVEIRLGQRRQPIPAQRVPVFAC